jgi:hypothetical protein
MERLRAVELAAGARTRALRSSTADGALNAADCAASLIVGEFHHVRFDNGVNNPKRDAV